MFTSMRASLVRPLGRGSSTRQRQRFGGCCLSTPITLFRGTCLPLVPRILIARVRRRSTSANCSIYYAPHFDESLARLQYRAPQLIAERLTRSVAPNGNLEVLDAGCGTGLCGPLLKPFAARLVGVDLSACMLAEAAKRALYDELVEAELGAYLAAHPSSFNIIVCCDTLVYIGQLEDTIAAAATATATALQPDGLLLFTLEHLAEGGEDRRYRLAPTGRFSHSVTYVRATLANAGLVDIIADPIIPRLECGEPVRGILVMARSSPRKTTTRGCELGKRSQLPQA